MKKAISVVSAIFLSCAYILLWLSILHLANFCYKGNLFRVFSDLVGNWIVYLGYFLAFLLFVIPLIAICVKRKKIHKILGISFAATFLFCAFAVITFYSFAGFYHNFTPEKWKQYPTERWIMLQGLEANHEIIGTNKENVLDLLGEPDEIVENEDYCLYYYRSISGDAVIEFYKDKVSDANFLYPPHTGW